MSRAADKGYARKAERLEKLIPFSGWNVPEFRDDNGIVSWMKRQTQIDLKTDRKTKKDILQPEYRYPVKKKCSAIEDLEVFLGNSLHENLLLPKKQILPNVPKAQARNVLRYQYSHIKPKVYEIRRSNTTANVKDLGKNLREERLNKEIDLSSRNVTLPEQRPASECLLDRRRRSAPNAYPEGYERRISYSRIKSFLYLSNLSNSRYRTKFEEEEDEGYSSKTSSAEDKEGSKGGSQLQRTFCSMVDLSELPSHENNVNKLLSQQSKIRFSYTHQNGKEEKETSQPTWHPGESILPSIKSKTDASQKKLPRVVSTPVASESESETDDYQKPMTLVLRKITIQNAAPRPVERVGSSNHKEESGEDRTLEQDDVQLNTNGQQRRAGSPTQKANNKIKRPSSYQSQCSTKSNSSGKQKLDHSYKDFDQEERTYCIGDLIPAMDKNIYKNHTDRLSVPKDDVKQELKPIENDIRDRMVGQEDGYMLLKKGMDLLTGRREKTTLGPPPFRPNQTRHPLTRDNTNVDRKHLGIYKCQISDHLLHTQVTYIPDNKRGGKTKLNHERNGLVDPDKTAQKKLQEAFSRFYNNRQQSLAREYTRVIQSMRKT